MSHPNLLPPAAVSSERQMRILDAAERCFVRSGFHRTTMQDVAAEAEMSPGNLYRYFPSKDALVVALAERDRARIGNDFDSFSQSADFLGIFRHLAHKHFAEEPRERAILCLEIWAEATRNKTFASLSETFDNDISGRMVALFRQAQERGAIAADVDLGSLASLVSMVADGLFVRRAILSSFDAEREVRTLMAVLEAAFAGKIDLKASQHQSPSEKLEKVMS
ncbi:TetR/AcrR family transcriptional regulator [Microvirga puerhi]|uniref:TetR/AcrR family transcriptional regulator n=1 Tax=Microvirga puerhi TaxID=2876078 RepID=A0ABS7VTD2_9HYPH|nr:TetR/AcrR family transcriptional regulator [Microvirga puerhi]MBZ6078815.1 TetR/AcrR family transcriptional regulator [Microvirga puerhi]